jgi:hypothetical protein
VRKVTRSVLPINAVYEDRSPTCGLKPFGIGKMFFQKLAEILFIVGIGLPQWKAKTRPQGFA